MKNFITPIKTRILLIIFLCSSFSFAHATEYVLDKAASNLAFSGTHAGKLFTGKFDIWDAEIKFDAENLDTSSIKVLIDTASANTGDAMYDGTLPTKDWFDVKNHKQATFVSELISKKDDNTYIANGKLTIRDKSVPISFEFALSVLSTPPVKTSFTLTLERLAYDIGRKSDAEAEWVSNEIALNITLTANPK